MTRGLFPDNTVLCNFAAVDRLDLLRDWLRGRGRWTAAVAFEAGRSARHLPALSDVLDEGWLGEPIEVSWEEDVDRTRRVVFGGRRQEPLKHLGEAETCVLIQRDVTFQGSWWLSDDRDAVEYAKGRGIVTHRTIDIFRFLVADGDLTAEHAYDLMQAMYRAGRELDLPASPNDLR